MSVNFYPHLPLNELEKHVIDQSGKPLYGEIDTYQMLFSDLTKSQHDWHVWHRLHIPNHSHSYHIQKTEGEIDFLILSKWGLLILEVKGGPITLSNHQFFYGNPRNDNRCQNPFEQARGYKQSLIEYVLKQKRIFCCEAVALPHVEYDIFQEDHPLFNSEKLWTKKRASHFNNSIEKFLINVYITSRQKHIECNRLFPEYSAIEIEKLKTSLNPQTHSRSLQESTMEWLKIDNLEILEGLIRNPKIMIQGPPGSGKTTMAKAFIDSKENKKGLYICWNRFLSVRMRNLLNARATHNNIEVLTYCQLIRKFEPNIPIENLLNIGNNNFIEIVKKTLMLAVESSGFEKYDFVVIDEGQDLFFRGVDIVLDKLVTGGLENGNILILYDLNQSYFNEYNSSAEVADILLDYFTHFKLNKIKRSEQSPRIRELTKKLGDTLNFDSIGSSLNYPEVKIKKLKSLSEVKNYIFQNVLKLLRTPENARSGADYILLVESGILNRNTRTGEDFKDLFLMNDVEELNDDNLDTLFNILKYTTPLKFKGLESRHVVLITREPRDYNISEFYVGVSRAIESLQIIILGPE